jgi:hypothetical protein
MQPPGNKFLSGATLAGDMERGWDGSAKGILCPSDTYTFVATYEGTENPGKTKKVQGSFILMR